MLEYYTPIVTAGVFLTDSLNPPTGLRPRLTSPHPGIWDSYTWHMSFGRWWVAATSVKDAIKAYKAVVS